VQGNVYRSNLFECLDTKARIPQWSLIQLNLYGGVPLPILTHASMTAISRDEILILALTSRTALVYNAQSRKC